jgi:hypothetical protein
MTDVRRLEAAANLLRNDGKAKRAKGPTFTLTFTGPNEAILQGARGKTVAVFQGTPEQIKEQAFAHARHLPDATIQVYE